MSVKYFNAIVYCGNKEGKSQQNFLKFHSIKNTPHHKEGFAKFVKKEFPSVQHINFYSKDTKAFVERLYLL